MTLKQLMYLVELPKYDSINKTAEALLVTQPCITRAVKDLEDELGIKIVERTTRGIKFTTEGQDLLFYARSVIEQANAIQYHFNSKITNKPVHYTVSSQHHAYVVAAMANLVNRMGKNKYYISIREGKTEDVIEDLSTGKSSLGFISSNKQTEGMLNKYFKANDLFFTPILIAPHHAFLSNTHPLAGKKEVSYEELAEYPYVSYQEDDLSIFLSEGEILKNSITRRVYVKERGSMYEIMNHTHCYNIGSGCIYNTYIYPGITSVPIRNGSTMQLGYILKKDHYIREEIRQFIRDLKTILWEAAPESARMLSRELYEETEKGAATPGEITG